MSEMSPEKYWSGELMNFKLEILLQRIHNVRFQLNRAAVKNKFNADTDTYTSWSVFICNTCACIEWGECAILFSSKKRKKQENSQ